MFVPSNQMPIEFTQSKGPIYYPKPKKPASGIEGNKVGNVAIRIIPGMNTFETRLVRRAREYVEFSGQRIRWTHNRTFKGRAFGTLRDFWRCFKNLLFGHKSKEVAELAKQIVTDLKEGKPLLLIAHSQGTMHLRKALIEIKTNKPEQWIKWKERLYVVALGGPKNLSNDLGREVINVRTSSDPVAKLARTSRKRYTVIKVHSNIPRDHKWGHEIYTLASKVAMVYVQRHHKSPYKNLTLKHAILRTATYGQRFSHLKSKGRV